MLWNLWFCNEIVAEICFISLINFDSRFWGLRNTGLEECALNRAKIRSVFAWGRDLFFLAHLVMVYILSRQRNKTRVRFDGLIDNHLDVLYFRYRAFFDLLICVEFAFDVAVLFWLFYFSEIFWLVELLVHFLVKFELLRFRDVTDLFHRF